MNLIRHYLKRIPIILFFYKKYVYQKHLFYFQKDPKILANIGYKKAFKRDINWELPSDLIEKIIWMQFNTDTRLWTQLADKYLARDYVKNLGYGHMLNQLYGRYVTEDEIDFNSLPSKFVIKPNNACEEVILVKDKSKLNLRKTKRLINHWLKYRYGIMNAQLHYLKIQPSIIIEEFLNENYRTDSSLTDYKFSCFNGIVESILVVSSRNTQDHSYKLNLYDTDWNSLNHFLCQNVNDRQIPKPVSLNQMIDACKTLGYNIPYVRIDFYEIEGKSYFGEFTFTTGFGYFTEEYYGYLGSKLEIAHNHIL